MFLYTSSLVYSEYNFVRLFRELSLCMYMDKEKKDEMMMFLMIMLMIEMLLKLYTYDFHFVMDFLCSFDVRERCTAE